MRRGGACGAASLLTGAGFDPDAFGLPAFFAVLAIFWLMIARPAL